MANVLPLTITDVAECHNALSDSAQISVPPGFGGKPKRRKTPTHESAYDQFRAIVGAVGWPVATPTP